MNQNSQAQINNLSAALVSDVRFVEFKTALYESIGKKSYNDASEAYGAIKGQIRAFEQIEEWAKEGTAAKLAEAQPKAPDQPEPPKYADPDLER